MKIGVSTYSFHGYCDTLGMKGVLDKIKEFGAECVDFVPFENDTAKAIELAGEYNAYMKEIGLEAGCYCMGANFLAADVEAEKQKIRDGIDIALALGCPVLRFDVAYGFAPEKKTKRGYDDFIEIAASHIREMAEYAAKKGIKVCTENHGRFSQDSCRVEKLINAVGHENFGTLVDMGNFLCADENPVHAVGVMAPYAFHCHAKDFFLRDGSLDNPGEGWFITRGMNYLRGTVVGQGNVPVKQCVRILKSAGYDGMLAIEFEGVEDPLWGIRVGVANLKKIVAEA